MIRAECHTLDNKRIVQFDATPRRLHQVLDQNASQAILTQT
jgi:hypothetical protein